MKKFVNSFQEEMVTTGLVMIVTVAGSFYFLSRMISPSGKTGLVLDEAVLGRIDEKINEDQEKQKVAGARATQVTATTRPSVAPTFKPSPNPTTVPNLVEIPYRPAQEFENDDYLISFSRPRLILGDDTRSFKVDVVMANKAVGGEGLGNRVYATVLKDGEIIVQEAVMSNTKTVSLKQGETISFTAKISLIEETEVSQIIFAPGDGLPQVTYQVYPL